MNFNDHIFNFFCNFSMQINEESILNMPIAFWGVGVFGLAICAGVLVAYKKRMQNEDGYVPIAT